eukprot:5947428-Pleurochrysis_carterae.AAC.1
MAFQQWPSNHGHSTARVQGIMFVLTVGPCLLFVAIGLPKLDARSWVAIEGEYDGALLLSWCLWLYSGFAWLGLLAGEARSPPPPSPLTSQRSASPTRRNIWHRHHIAVICVDLHDAAPATVPRRSSCCHLCVAIIALAATSQRVHIEITHHYGLLPLFGF